MTYFANGIKPTLQAESQSEASK